MKKSFIFILGVSLFALLFTSCASIPEPSEKTTTMLYGTIDYYGSRQYAGSSTPDITNKKGGIKLTLKNLNTGRTYNLVSSNKGEFKKFNLPLGYYAIKEVGGEYSYDGRNWWFKFNPPVTNPSARFSVRQGVTNIGHIRIDVDYSGNKSQISWGNDFSGVKEQFEEKYIESTWNDQPWHTLTGSPQ